MDAPILFLSPTETSRRLGVSVRALRLYERRGLVRPVRTSAGWRTYGPDQVARLHQVLTLKGFGLSLARIGEILAGRAAELDEVLALQEAGLQARRRELDQALAAIASARQRLAGGGRLSLDDLMTLVRETRMTQATDDQSWSQDLMKFYQRRFSKADYDAIAAQKFSAIEAFGHDPDSFAQAWQAVIADATRLMQAGDPSAPEGRAVLERWRELTNLFTGGDPKLAGQATEAWKDAMAEPGLASRLPVSQELWTFMVAVAQSARAA